MRPAEGDGDNHVTTRLSARRSVTVGGWSSEGTRPSAVRNSFEIPRWNPESVRP